MCFLSSCWNVPNSRNLRGHSPLQGSFSGLVCLLPLSCPPLSIPWPLPPAFEAWRPSLLLPDRIPHILWETGRSPASSPRHKNLRSSSLQQSLYSAHRLPTAKMLLERKTETTANTFLIKLQQNYFIPRNVKTKKKPGSKSALGSALQICEDLNSWHQFAWASFGRARPCSSEHRPDLHLMQS